MDRPLDVDHDPGDREATLVAALAVVARPLDLRVGERDQRGVRPDPVDEQPLRYPQLRSREPHAERVVHDARHAGDLLTQRVVEAVDRCGAGLQDRITEAADEGHGGEPPGLELGIELGRALLVLLNLYLEIALL
jgi:hypothetical protein